MPTQPCTEKAAQSVGADERQGFPDAGKLIFYASSIANQPADNKRFPAGKRNCIITLDDLMNEDVRPIDFLVDGLLSTGLYILAGAPKSGKSWLLLGCAGILTRFMPSIMLAAYVVSSMTVSEFTAAMQRMHITEKIIIPMSVMFRFFPTVGDEFSSINAAMKMRDIRLGGKNVSKMIEYRMIPLMTCTVKIGEELSAAALTRGLGGTVKRTNVCKIGFHIQDIVAIAFCLGAFAALALSWIGLI